ncbi:PTS lactose transporter subunit IIC [Palleronia sediminis]|uniref:PTS lactose transporter subunit IIC n=1 Tax=Palleronia sediminis TaxID=2547833 RepID=A0A4R6A3L7_9RHOB|nr:PTS sugar transporter subunit IIA [Palleronia sediminis]TDL78190.1 PTS lactose transporter subunit IIC [Palleronia sediminis]
MILSHLLRSEAIRVVPSASSKKRLFHLIAEIGEEVYGLPAEAAIEALLERENLGPTGVGNGVALPHARLDGCEKVHGVFLRLVKPLDYGAPDRLPVDLFFGLFAPSDAGVDHLKALASVSRTLRDADLCARLRANDEVNAIYALLTEPTATHAA